MDTTNPFLKIGSQVFRGEMTPLIGEEVILGLIRSRSYFHAHLLLILR
jgi:hypothetical protein